MAEAGVDSEDDEDQVLVVEGQVVVVVDVEEGPTARGSVNFDPLACYRCGVRGHLARDCPLTKGATSQGSGSVGLSRGKFSQSGHKGRSVDEAVDGKSNLVPSTSCTMRTGMNTPWTTQDSCTSHWTLGRLLLRRPQWKLKKIQKTEKVPCQCDCAMHHNVFNWRRTAKNKKKLEGSL